MIQTSRFFLLPLSFAHLEHCLSDRSGLEAELHFLIAREVFTEDVTRAIGMKLAKMETLSLELHPWQTYWLIVLLKPEKIGAGLIGFKGYLNARGEVDVGYSIAPQFQGQGYTTEALRALCTWAFRDPACRAITATTVANPASNRVLHKVGAQIVDAREGKMDWKIYRQGFQGLGEEMPENGSQTQPDKAAREKCS